MKCPNKKNLKESGFCKESGYYCTHTQEELCKEKYKEIDKQKIREVERTYLSDIVKCYMPDIPLGTPLEWPDKTLEKLDDFILAIMKQEHNKDMVAICEMAIKYLELVQEMKSNQNLHDGWIPVEKRLPTKEEYLKDDGRFICDDGNRRYQGLFDIYDGKFKFSKHILGLKFELIEDKCVIAWRPLPEPYKND